MKECGQCNFNCVWCYDIYDNLCNYFPSQVGIFGTDNIPRIQNKECEYEKCKLYGKCSNCITRR